METEIIQETTPLTLVDEVAVRYKDAPWVAGMVDSLNLTVGGAGGIGSYLCFLLYRMGFTLTVYDMDRVGEENLGVQMFSKKSVGQYKSQEVKNIAYEYCAKGTYPKTASEFYEFGKTSPLSSVAFSCFDNMKARKLMFEKWKYLVKNSSNPNSYFFMDSRMGAENFEIYCIVGNDDDRMRRYEESLFDDSDLPDLPCTFRTTPFTPFTLTGMMVSIFVNFLSNITTKEAIRSVPFKVEYFSAIQHIEYEY